MGEANVELQNPTLRLPAYSAADWSGLRRDATGRIDPAEVGVRFEQMFAQQLVREMSNSLQEGFFGDSGGSHVYQGFFESFLAQRIAESGSLGIAPEVQRFLEKGAKS